MTTAEFIQIIQEQARPLLEGMYGELRTNLGTSHYHRLSNEEIFRRGNVALTRLAEWLSTHDNGELHRFSLEVGRDRFEDGVPLGQVVLSFLLGEKQIWNYTTQLGKQVDEKFRLDVAEFFARTIYSISLGYAEALDESQRRSRGAASTSPVPAVAPQQDDIQVSRAGEVGEHGG